MNWFYLLLAGLFEIGWIISLKYTEGFTRFVPLIFYGICGFTSAYFLSLALKTIPLGVAYAIWMGIAMIGATVFGIFYLKEPYQLFRMICILLILCGVAGLKFSVAR